MLSLQFLAVLLGALIIATRLPGVFYPKPFAKVCKEFLKDDKIMRGASFLPFSFAIATILAKPMFTYDLTLVMSALGWLMLVGSLYMMWEPQMMAKRAMSVLKNHALVQGLCVIAVALGAALIHLGLVVY